MTGLVLTGGGAHAAYQVGALRAIASVVGDRCPFDVVTGVSAGAINAAAIAVEADDFASGTARLESMWRALTPERIYRTDVASLASIATGWMRRLGGGGHLDAEHVNALLDTAPLRSMLGDALDLPQIAEHVASGRLRAAAVSATSYHDGTAVTFFHAGPAVRPWTRAGRTARRVALTLEHVLASSAIPVFFPPVTIDGAPFGDGCVRLSAPLSPAIHLGADRVLAIGVRSAEADAAPVPDGAPLSPAEIGGVLLDAVFLDSLDTDAERLERINGTLAALEPHARDAQRLRRIPLLVLRPSRALGAIASERYQELPRALRYLLRGIGGEGPRGWELVSYLAFEPSYLAELIDLGYRDTIARRDELAAFLRPV